MHICHINLARGFSGGERQTLNLIQRLADEGYTQTLITMPGSRLATAAQNLPISHRSTKHSLLGHLRQNGYDLIHCHDGKSVYWGRIEHALRGTPYLITRRVENPLSQNRISRSAYTRAACVVCLSRAVAGVVRRQVPEATTAIIPSSFSAFSADPQLVAGIREPFEGKFVIGQVGRLLRIKGFDVTIEAAKRLAHSHPQAVFLFLGEGPEERNLRQQARNLANVHFIGHQEAIGNWLAALDLMVFPSRTEGLGSTVLEAMQHGVPVIASDVGGIPDMISHGKTGLLVPAGDSGVLADAVIELLENPARARELATAARTALEAFSPESVASRYIKLYASL
jgi:L-malate glycosyltransferase